LPLVILRLRRSECCEEVLILMLVPSSFSSCPHPRPRDHFIYCHVRIDSDGWPSKNQAAVLPPPHIANILVVESVCFEQTFLYSSPSVSNTGTAGSDPQCTLSTTPECPLLWDIFVAASPLSIGGLRFFEYSSKWIHIRGGTGIILESAGRSAEMRADKL
jgi:hypothetical protein